MSEHGTTSRYTQGCRCERCRAANAEYQRAYQAKRKIKTGASEPIVLYGGTSTAPFVAWRTSTPIVADSTISVTQTAPGAWTYDVRSPLEQLVDACIDLREAFAAYHQAHTQEPA